MSDDLIRYDILTQEALRKVIRKVLEEVERTGLPGEHHFFITFDTNFPGVRLSTRMKERYPEEMTIVIQHSFWNLQVDENSFEIDLSFDDIRERLRVPFSAVKGFFDPAVKFGLQFDVGELTSAVKEPTRAPGPEKNKSTSKGKKAIEPPQVEEAEAADIDAADDPANGAEVVSLDSFRKNK